MIDSRRETNDAFTVAKGLSSRDVGSDEVSGNGNAVTGDKKDCGACVTADDVAFNIVRDAIRICTNPPSDSTDLYSRTVGNRRLPGHVGSDEVTRDDVSVERHAVSVTTDDVSFINIERIVAAVGANDVAARHRCNRCLVAQSGGSGRVCSDVVTGNRCS